MACVRVGEVGGSALGATLLTCDVRMCRIQPRARAARLVRSLPLGARTPLCLQYYTHTHVSRSPVTARARVGAPRAVLLAPRHDKIILYLVDVL